MKIIINFSIILILTYKTFAQTSDLCFEKSSKSDLFKNASKCHITLTPKSNPAGDESNQKHFNGKIISFSQASDLKKNKRQYYTNISNEVKDKNNEKIQIICTRNFNGAETDPVSKCECTYENIIYNSQISILTPKRPEGKDNGTGDVIKRKKNYLSPIPGNQAGDA